MSTWAQASLLGLAVLLVYVLGACSTIYVGDSGELVAAVHTLGIPHPSSYPLYVLLGKLWTLLIPIGSIAFRMSLFSAVCAAAASAGLYLLGRELRLSALSAAVAAFILAFSPSFWSQANIQRVYALNALFVVVASIAVVSWVQSRRPRDLIAALFLAALGASNHTYMGVYLVVLAAYVLATEPALLRQPRVLVTSVFAVGLGLSPYLYLPLRSRANPRLDWGNPETLPAMLDVILRREAWERAWIEAPSDLLVIAGDLLLAIGSELYWVGAFLALLGLVFARRKRWPVGFLVALMAGNFLAMALHGSRSDLFYWHRYYIPTFLIVSLFAGLGLEVLRERWSPKVGWIALALPLGMLAVGYPQFDRSRYRIADDFSRTLLDAVPPGAHLSASDDNILFVLMYLQLVEGVRPDIDLILQGVGGSDLQPLRFDPESDPVYFTHHPNWQIPGLDVVATGLTFRVQREGMPLPELVIPKQELEGETDPTVPKDYLTQNLIGHFHYMLGVSFESRDWLRAEAEFATARAAAPDNDVLFYNLGLIYRRNGLLDRSLAAFEHSAAINPRHIATKQAVKAADRIAETLAELERLQQIETELAAGAVLGNLDPDSATFHRAMAALLLERDEGQAARGHALQALQNDLPLLPTP